MEALSNLTTKGDHKVTPDGNQLTNACRICGSTQLESHIAREMNLGLRDVFTYLECKECGTIQLDRIPTNLDRYYPSDYYSFVTSTEKHFTNKLTNFLKAARCQYAVTGRGLLGRLMYAKWPNIQLRSLAGIQNLQNDSSILDVGSGTGFLLYELSNAGFNNLTGVDPFIHNDIDYGRFKVHKKHISDLAGSWNVVMLHHSLEHVEDPLGMLKACAERLSPGGTCLVRIPVSSSYAWKTYQTNWIQLDAPRHIFLFSETSIEFLAQKAGLRLDSVIYDSTAMQFWGSEQYIKDIPLHSDHSYIINPSKSIFSPAQIKTFEQRASQLNRNGQGDQAVFYLRHSS